MSSKPSIGKTKPTSKKGYSRSCRGKGAPKAQTTGTSADDTKVTILPTQSDHLVHPSQHFDYDSGWMSFGFVRTIQIENPEWDKPKRKRVLCIVTNKGEVIPCIESELAKHGITLASPPMWNSKKGNRISGAVLDAFIKSGGKKPVHWSLSEWFNFVVETLKGVLDYENEDLFAFHAIWIFGTYCHRAFESFSYNFYHGLTMTGKTRSLEALEQTTFNAILSPNMSPSSLFRSVESMAPTLLMDESENLKDKERSAEIRELVLSGYKKGASVTRTEPEPDGGWIVKEYGTYSPKAFANISGLDDVLGNRCVPILMRRSNLKTVLTARINTRKRKRAWSDIRDQTYLLVYKYWRTICETIERHCDTEVMEGIDGRPLELWHSIFVLSEMFEKAGVADIQDKMYQLAKQYVEDMLAQFEQSSEGAIIRAIKDMMWDSEPPFEDRYYRFQDIKKYFAKQIAFADEEIDEASGEITSSKIKIPNWVRPKFLYGQLRKLGFKEFKGSGGSKSVYLTKDILIDLWERYMEDWKEPSPKAGQTTMHSFTDGSSTTPLSSTLEAITTHPSEKTLRDIVEPIKSVTRDLIVDVMLERELWTRDELEKEIVDSLGYDKTSFDKRMDAPNRDPRVIEVLGKPSRFKLTDACKKLLQPKKPKDDEQDGEKYNKSS